MPACRWPQCARRRCVTCWSSGWVCCMRQRRAGAGTAGSLVCPGSLGGADCGGGRGLALAVARPVGGHQGQRVRGRGVGAARGYAAAAVVAPAGARRTYVDGSAGVGVGVGARSSRRFLSGGVASAVPAGVAVDGRGQRAGGVIVAGGAGGPDAHARRRFGAVATLVRLATTVGQPGVLRESRHRGVVRCGSRGAGADAFGDGGRCGGAGPKRPDGHASDSTDGTARLNDAAVEGVTPCAALNAKFTANRHPEIGELLAGIFGPEFPAARRTLANPLAIDRLPTGLCPRPRVNPAGVAPVSIAPRRGAARWPTARTDRPRSALWTMRRRRPTSSGRCGPHRHR
eukprot:ctg_2061.g596